MLLYTGLQGLYIPIDRFIRFIYSSIQAYKVYKFLFTGLLDLYIPIYRFTRFIYLYIQVYKVYLFLFTGLQDLYIPIYRFTRFIYSYVQVYKFTYSKTLINRELCNLVDDFKVAFDLRNNLRHST